MPQLQGYLIPLSGKHLNSILYFGDGKSGRNLEGLNPADLRGVVGDHENSQIVRTGIRRHEKESDFLWIVGMRSSHHLFTIGKSDFGFAALILRRKRLGFGVFAIADKIPRKEDGFQILHLHVRAFALGRVLFEEKTEALFLRGEIVNVAFQAPTVEERHHSFVAIVESVWRRHSVSLLTELHHRECYAIGLRHACTSYKPNVLRYRKRHYSIAEAEVKLLDRVDAPGK